jgi:hypothetical protein
MFYQFITDSSVMLPAVRQRATDGCSSRKSPWLANSKIEKVASHIIPCTVISSEADEIKK